MKPEEDCEAKLRAFLAQEMNITHHVELGNVHRFGKNLTSTINHRDL